MVKVVTGSNISQGMDVAFIIDHHATHCHNPPNLEVPPHPEHLTLRKQLCFKNRGKLFSGFSEIPSSHGGGGGGRRSEKEHSQFGPKVSSIITDKDIRSDH
jgi:hypothetical protein